jgi:hypothetical protein
VCAFGNLFIASKIVTFYTLARPWQAFELL